MFIFSDVDNRDAEDCDTENSGVSITKNNKDEQFKFHFSAKNVFKPNSSDNEAEDETFYIDEQVVEQSKNDNHMNGLFGYNDTFFFKRDDVRFNGVYMDN